MARSKLGDMLGRILSMSDSIEMWVGEDGTYWASRSKPNSKYATKPYSSTKYSALTIAKLVEQIHRAMKDD